MDLNRVDQKYGSSQHYESKPERDGTKGHYPCDVGSGQAPCRVHAVAYAASRDYGEAAGIVCKGISNEGCESDPGIRLNGPDVTKCQDIVKGHDQVVEARKTKGQQNVVFRNGSKRGGYVVVAVLGEGIMKG